MKSKSDKRRNRPSSRWKDAHLAAKLVKSNIPPVGETRTRSQMMLQHASWYLLAMYHKLDKNIWDAHKVLGTCYIEIASGYAHKPIS